MADPIRIYCDDPEYSETWIDFSPRWTQGDVTKMLAAQNDDFYSFLRSKVVACHIQTVDGGAITDPAQILVYQEALFKAVPVALRRSSNGLSFKLTDASQRKVDRLMEQCRDKHGSAHYRKGVLPDKTASIGVFYTTHTEPLT